MSIESWGFLVIPAVLGFIYWDYKRVQRMVVPPPPKPAPLPVAAEPIEEAQFDPIEFADALIALDKAVPDRPINGITGYEWAKIKVKIAEGNLKVASGLIVPMVILGVLLCTSKWPDYWWVSVIVVPLIGWNYIKPFQIAYDKAVEYAENSDFK